MSGATASFFGGRRYPAWAGVPETLSFGFGGPNAEGVLLGTAESWLDPRCDANPDEPTPFQEGMTISSMPDGSPFPDGHYTLKPSGIADVSFTIPRQ